MTTDSAPHPVLVVIPVYGNIEATRRCLDSLSASDLPDHVSVLLIDDHSPDESLSALCRDIARRDSYELLVNEQNLGFVASANRGFEFKGGADVLLLNSDTVVTGDWISRLQACAYRRDNIGTVTPFTNNGTICSYPVFNTSNPLPDQWTAAELDGLFATANEGLFCEVPTAVGFCMYIKRACLDDTGTRSTPSASDRATARNAISVSGPAATAGRTRSRPMFSYSMRAPRVSPANPMSANAPPTRLSRQYTRNTMNWWRSF
ncbi:MAG: glycosyltransferase [Halioglobus sp.]|nr:glycosyltransferase [Halioglobus sp.]